MVIIFKSHLHNEYNDILLKLLVLHFSHPRTRRIAENSSIIRLIIGQNNGYGHPALVKFNETTNNFYCKTKPYN